jgi:hypothetical protein
MWYILIKMSTFRDLPPEERCLRDQEHEEAFADIFAHRGPTPMNMKEFLTIVLRSMVQSTDYHIKLNI